MLLKLVLVLMLVLVGPTNGSCPKDDALMNGFDCSGPCGFGHHCISLSFLTGLIRWQPPPGYYKRDYASCTFFCPRSRSPVDVELRILNDLIYPFSWINNESSGKLQVSNTNSSISPVMNFRRIGNEDVIFSGFSIKVLNLDVFTNANPEKPASTISLTDMTISEMALKNLLFPDWESVALVRLANLNGFLDGFFNNQTVIKRLQSVKALTLKDNSLKHFPKQIFHGGSKLTNVHIIDKTISNVVLDYITWERIQQLSVATFSFGDGLDDCSATASKKKIYISSPFYVCVLPDERTNKPSIISTKMPLPTDGQKPELPSSNNGDTGKNGNNKSSSDNGLLIGLIVGGVCVLAILILFVYFRHRRNKKNKKTSSQFTSERGNVDYSKLTGGDHSKTGDLSYILMNDEELTPFQLNDQVVIGEDISSGTFGIVHIGKYDDNLVAIKQLSKKRRIDKKEVEQYLKEIKLMSRLHHPNIVQFVGVFWEKEGGLSAVTEFMQNGDLRGVLEQKLNSTDEQGLSDFSWGNQKLSLSMDIIKAIIYMHSFKPMVIHRDLKSKNVLIGKDMSAKLTDFGTSRESIMDKTMTLGVGTALWMAPELIRGDKYNESSDIYSFGVILTEMDTCELPFMHLTREKNNNMSLQKVFYLVSSGKLKPTVSSTCPEDIREIADQCLQCDASKRPTAAEVLKMLKIYKIK